MPLKLQYMANSCRMLGMPSGTLPSPLASP